MHGNHQAGVNCARGWHAALLHGLVGDLMIDGHAHSHCFPAWSHQSMAKRRDRRSPTLGRGSSPYQVLYCASGLVSTWSVGRLGMRKNEIMAAGEEEVRACSAYGSIATAPLPPKADCDSPSSSHAKQHLELHAVRVLLACEVTDHTVGAICSHQHVPAAGRARSIRAKTLGFPSGHAQVKLRKCGGIASSPPSFSSFPCSLSTLPPLRMRCFCSATKSYCLARIQPHTPALHHSLLLLLGSTSCSCEGCLRWRVQQQIVHSTCRHDLDVRLLAALPTHPNLLSTPTDNLLPHPHHTLPSTLKSGGVAQTLPYGC